MIDRRCSVMHANSNTATVTASQLGTYAYSHITTLTHKHTHMHASHSAAGTATQSHRFFLFILAAFWISFSQVLSIKFQADFSFSTRTHLHNSVRSCLLGSTAGSSSCTRDELAEIADTFELSTDRMVEYADRQQRDPPSDVERSPADRLVDQTGRGQRARLDDTPDDDHDRDGDHERLGGKSVPADLPDQRHREHRSERNQHRTHVEDEEIGTGSAAAQAAHASAMTTPRAVAHAALARCFLRLPASCASARRAMPSGRVTASISTAFAAAGCTFVASPVGPGAPRR